MTKNLKQFLQEDGSFFEYSPRSSSMSFPEKLDFVLSFIQSEIRLGDGSKSSTVPLDNLLAAETMEYEEGEYLILKSEGEYVVAVEVKELGGIGARVYGMNDDGKYASLIMIPGSAGSATCMYGGFNFLNDPDSTRQFKDAVSEELVKKLEQYDNL